MNSRFNDPHRAQRDLLRGCELLGGLPPDVLSELVAASRIVELSANRTLYEAGELIREAHILFNGSVKRAVSMPGGATRTAASISALFDDAPRLGVVVEGVLGRNAILRHQRV